MVLRFTTKWNGWGAVTLSKDREHLIWAVCFAECLEEGKNLTTVGANMKNDKPGVEI